MSDESQASEKGTRGDQFEVETLSRVPAAGSNAVNAQTTSTKTLAPDQQRQPGEKWKLEEVHTLPSK